MSKKERISPFAPEDPLVLPDRRIPSDVLGSYTGWGIDDLPVQDADDL